MKIIDERGKLFGKINLVDLIILIVILAVIIGLVWKVGGSRLSNAVEGNHGTHIEYQVVCANVDNSVVANVQEDYEGQLMSNGTMLDGNVVGCEVQPYYINGIDSNGNVVQIESQTSQNLVFTIDCYAPYAENAYAMGSQELRVGKAHIVKTTELEIPGTISSMEILEN